MSGSRFLKGTLALVLVALWVVPASAQTATDQRGYVVGFGGGSATEVTSAFFGGGVGFNVTPNLQITADFGRMQDVEAPFTREDLAVVDGSLAELGVTSSWTVKMPTNYLTGGLRFRFGSNWPVQPYLVAHAGIAHMSPSPSFTIEGVDITSMLMEEPYFQGTFREETSPMATFGGGVTARLARWIQVDFGYKYSGIFINENFMQDYEASPHSHSRIDTHRFYGGFGLAF